MRNLAALDCKPTLRSAEGKTFVTDNGNYIADCAFGVIESPAELSSRLKSIPGVVEHGLFVKMTETVIVGSGEGTIAYL